MGLRIQNNISAMNTHRQLSISDANLSKSLERLSSGYRINRAADDAAGLAISQGFRADVASFKVAARNTSEAISTLQIAEGGADQIGSMLTRLKELATQASSANAADSLTTINSEASKVLAEINRIAAGTKYGDTTLIDGTYGITINATGTLVTSANGFNSMTGMKAGYTYRIDVDDIAGSDRNISITAFDASFVTVGVETVFGYTAAAAGATSDVNFNSLGVTLTINSDLSLGMSGVAVLSDVTAGTNGNSTFQIGNTNDANNQLTVSISGMRTTELHINGLALDSAASAQDALSSIDLAVDTLSVARATIGAFQNRLSFASANLSTIVENVQAAESVIRDVDMASEMTSFTKNQILLQSGTAMLAQANMAPQIVLQLLG